MQFNPPSTWAPVLLRTGLGAAGRDPLFPNNNSGLLEIARITHHLKAVAVIGLFSSTSHHTESPARAEVAGVEVEPEAAELEL